MHIRSWILVWGLLMAGGHGVHAQQQPNNRAEAIRLEVGELFLQGELALKEGKRLEGEAYFQDALAKGEDFPSAEQAKLLLKMGETLDHAGFTAQAIPYIRQAKSLFADFRMPTEEAEASILLAKFLINNGALGDALKTLMEGLAEYEKRQDTTFIIQSYGQIGKIYAYQDDLTKAEYYWESMLSLSESVRDTSGLVYGLVCLGVLDDLKGNPQASLTRLRRAADIHRQQNSPMGLGSTYLNMAAAYHSLDSLEQAIRYVQEAQVIYESLNNPSGIGTCYRMLGEIYLEKKAYTQSVRYLEEALKIYRQTQEVTELRTATQRLYEAHKAQGNFEQALRMHEEYRTLQDSLTSQEARQEILRQEYEYDYRKQLMADSLLFVQQQAETELSYQTRLARRNYFLLAGLGLVGLLFMLFFQRQKRLRQQQKLLHAEERFEMERREAEQRAQTEHLAELDQLKTRFYTNITHEFRTPLTVILGMAEKLANPGAAELIIRNGRKVLNLVNQLLDLSRLSAGGAQPQYQQIEMVSFTQYVGESFQSLAEQKYLRLTTYSEVEELWMDMDEEKYRHILTNLLSNAIKFTEEGGKVVLHLSTVGDQLHIKVKDNGIGIPPEELPHIFDRFYQVENAASNAGKGTGIGLSLVWEWVSLLKGNISVESQPGSGTTFSLNFPIQSEAAKRLESFGGISVDSELIQEIELIHATEPGNLPRLLLIEDNQDVATYIRSVLQGQYQVRVAFNGREGIQQALSEVPDLIITDVMMPHKDGFEVVQTLRKDIKTSHIPIIVLTAKASQQDKIKGLGHGADAYLMKPFNKAELLLRVRNLLEMRVRLQAKFVQYSLETPAPQNADEAFLFQINQVMERHYTDTNRSIADYAEDMQMSHTQFYRKLKGLTNLSPSQYLNQFRLEKACTLLHATSQHISEVAYEVGFSDPNYFSRVFTRTYGQSPTAFRNRDTV